MSHKAGFVNIIGNPNVGKSTLMNALAGEKLSIITKKAQTTRHRIMGIVNGDDFQIVYSDTPGIIKPNYLLQSSMMHFVETALEDADVFLLVTEIKEEFDNEKILNKLQSSKLPIIVALNKIDLSDQDFVTSRMEQWKKKLPGAIVIPVCALKSFNTISVFNSILENLPEAQPYFDKDEMTDKPQRFFAAEIIREKILIHYKKEIPYSVEVQIESFKEEEKIIRIRAIIYVERESQKIIIIGDGGKALKKVGTEARKDMESFMNKHVYLEMFVKVDKDWRNNKKELRRFGYER
jgi:GTPase